MSQDEDDDLNRSLHVLRKICIVAATLWVISAASAFYGALASL